MHPAGLAMLKIKLLNRTTASSEYHKKHVKSEDAPCIACHNAHNAYDPGEPGLIDLSYPIRDMSSEFSFIRRLPMQVQHSGSTTRHPVVIASCAVMGRSTIRRITDDRIVVVQSMQKRVCWSCPPPEKGI